MEPPIDDLEERLRNLTRTFSQGSSQLLGSDYSQGSSEEYDSQALPPPGPGDEPDDRGSTFRQITPLDQIIIDEMLQRGEAEGFDEEMLDILAEFGIFPEENRGTKRRTIKKKRRKTIKKKRRTMKKRKRKLNKTLKKKNKDLKK